TRADPAAGDPFLAARDRKAGMGGVRIAAAVNQSVAEQEGVAGASFHLLAGLHEQGLAALIILIEPDDHGENALVGEAGNGVEMRLVLAAGPVAQHLERLALRRRRSARRGDALI